MHAGRIRVPGARGPAYITRWGGGGKGRKYFREETTPTNKITDQQIYTWNGMNLEKVKSYKHLGVWFLQITCSEIKVPFLICQFTFKVE